MRLAQRLLRLLESPFQNRRLLLDGDTHRTSGACDHAHSSLEGCSIQVGHLGLRDLLAVSLGQLSDLGLVRYSRTGLDAASLLDQNRRRRRLGILPIDFIL